MSLRSVVKLSLFLTLFHLCYTLPLADAQQQEPSRLKIITHNVWYGFTKKPEPRHTEWLSWMQNQGPDVVVLQELNGYTAERLSAEAYSWGHAHSELLKEDGFSTGITSRYPISDVRKLREAFHHGLMRVKTGGIWIYVVHFHPSNFARRMEEARRLGEDVKQLPEQHPKIVLAGDFNGFSPADKRYYDSDPKLVPFFEWLDERDPKARNLNNGRLDYGGIEAILAQGYIDTIAHFRANEGSFTGTFPTELVADENHGTDRRLDYIFVSPNLLPAVSEAKILRTPLTETLSDHIPVMAVIDFGKP